MKSNNKGVDFIIISEEKKEVYIFQAKHRFKLLKTWKYLFQNIEAKKLFKDKCLKHGYTPIYVLTFLEEDEKIEDGLSELQSKTDEIIYVFDAKKITGYPLSSSKTNKN